MPHSPQATTPGRRYGYLGPEGTFSEAALRSLPESGSAALLPYESVPAALEAVRRGHIHGAMVPLENSVEGAVNVTLDELAAGEPVAITREVVLPVTLALLAPPRTRLADVKHITTHPHAEAQCRGWLAANLPDARVSQAASTAAAAALVADPGSGYDAAIAAQVAGDHYGLVAIASDVGDNGQAATRFVLVSQPAPLPAATGADRTSLVAFITEDHPGALLEILEQFAVRGVNLTRLESRPTGVGIGRYCFSIDCEGHLRDARVGEALMGLRRICADVRFLGSYPRADGAPATPKPGTADADFADAADWLRRVAEGES